MADNDFLSVCLKSYISNCSLDTIAQCTICLAIFILWIQFMFIFNSTLVNKILYFFLPFSCSVSDCANHCFISDVAFVIKLQVKIRFSFCFLDRKYVDSNKVAYNALKIENTANSAAHLVRMFFLALGLGLHFFITCHKLPQNMLQEFPRHFLAQFIIFGVIQGTCMASLWSKNLIKTQEQSFTETLQSRSVRSRRGQLKVVT